jgi:predicted ATPase
MSIRNVKAIPTLDIAFTERITLLHGANGIGKSTILDCIALLGHLATMRRMRVTNDGVAISLPTLGERLRMRSDLQEDVAARLDSIEKSASDNCTSLYKTVQNAGSIERWFNDAYIRTPRISYEITDSIIGGASHRFVIALVGPDGLTVSHVLNRTRCDDLDMADHLVLLIGDDERGIDRLLVHQADTSTTLVRNGTGGFFALHPIAAETAPGSRVVAINTDLADLGKRDQVRESVKDISLTLSDEIARLNLPFDFSASLQRRRFRFFDDLAGIMSRVITDPSLPKQIAGKRPFLQLTSCDLDENVPHVAFRRGDEDQVFSSDFMSAGENECFFVFLTLLGMDTRNGVVVLDEPELHIAEYCRPAFFEELYELTKKRDSQVIIATHSLFAMPDNESAQFLVVGRTAEKGGGVRYTCGPNPEYSLSLFKAYWRTGALFLAVAGAAHPFRALAAAAYGALERLGKERPIPVALIVGLITSAILALISDLANFLDVQSGHGHLVVIKLVIWCGLIVALTSGILFWAFRRRRR